MLSARVSHHGDGSQHSVVHMNLLSLKWSVVLLLCSFCEVFPRRAPLRFFESQCKRCSPLFAH